MHIRWALTGFSAGFIMWIVEVSDVSIPIHFLVVFGIIASGMFLYGISPIFWGVWRLSMRIRFQAPITLRHKEGKQPLIELGWMQDIVSHDLRDLGQLIKVRVDLLMFNGLVSTEPYFEVVVSVTNASVFAVKLVGGVGFIQVGTSRCQLEPQLSPRSSLWHGVDIKIRVHQPITPNTASQLRAQGDKDEQVNFLLTDFRLVFEVATEGYEGNKVEIPLIQSGYPCVPKA